MPRKCRRRLAMRTEETSKKKDILFRFPSQVFLPVIKHELKVTIISPATVFLMKSLQVLYTKLAATHLHSQLLHCYNNQNATKILTLDFSQKLPVTNNNNKKKHIKLQVLKLIR
jgi:hypothetical protein